MANALNKLKEFFYHHRSIVRDYWFEGNKNNYTEEEATTSLEALSFYCRFTEKIQFKGNKIVKLPQLWK
jgi:hypothetical protein